MSLYGEKWKINGVTTGCIKRVGTKIYEVMFEREYATIEVIEAINWAEVTIEQLSEEPCPLPTGGFEVVGSIIYDGEKRSYTVSVELRREYYGDVSAFAEELELRTAELEDTKSELKEAGKNIAELVGQLDSAKADIQQRDKAIEDKELQISKKDEEIAALNADLEEADATVMGLYEQIKGGANNE